MEAYIDEQVITIWSNKKKAISFKLLLWKQHKANVPMNQGKTTTSLNQFKARANHIDWLDVCSVGCKTYKDSTVNAVNDYKINK